MKVFANGHKYIGEFKDGMMHGEGMYEEDNGAKYQGIFEEDYMLSSTHGSVMLPGIGM